MDETSKIKERLLPLMKGRIIDIGAGRDPITPDAVIFDKGDGDAQLLREPVEGYDVVYSSHCLEHIVRPQEALLNWWRLVKVGGLLVVAVPEADAYEQHVWPSTFNPDHKHTFNISKSSCWCPASLNMSELVSHLPHHKVLSLQIVDTTSASGERRDQTLVGACAHIECIVEKQAVQQQRGSRLTKLAACPSCGRTVTLIGFLADGGLEVQCNYCATSGLFERTTG